MSELHLHGHFWAESLESARSAIIGSWVPTTVHLMSVFLCRALSSPTPYYRPNKKMRSVAAQSLTFLSTQAFGLSRANELVLYVCKSPYTCDAAPLSTEQGWYFMLELDFLKSQEYVSAHDHMSIQTHVHFNQKAVVCCLTMASQQYTAALR